MQLVLVRPAFYFWSYVVNDSRNSIRYERVPISAIRAYPHHARVHPKHQLNKIRRLVEQLDAQPVPVIVAPDLTIIDGHALCEVMSKLGATEIFVAIVQNQSPADIQALRLAINRIPEDAKWNRERLRGEIKSLIDVSFDLDLTGFDRAEIDFHLKLDVPESNVVEDEAAMPPLPDNPIARPGDIFALGPHRVGCGDALDGTFIERVREGKLADVCFTDPPYNLPIGGFVSGKGRNSHAEFVQGSGELSSQEFFSFIRTSLSVVKNSCSPGAIIFACIDWRSVLEMTAAGRALGMPLLNICVWVKSNGGMGALYSQPA